MDTTYMKAMYEFIIGTPDKVTVACAAMLIIVLSLAFYVLCKRKNGSDVGEISLYIKIDREKYDPNKWFIANSGMEYEPKKYSCWCFYKATSKVLKKFESRGIKKEITNHDRNVESPLDNKNGNIV